MKQFALVAAVAMLSVMSIAATAPAARAVTVYHLSVTVKVDGQSLTGTFRVVDVDSDALIDLAVGAGLQARIAGAFGTSTFAFPGSYTATFTILSSTITVTLHSTDSFTLKFA